MFKKHISTTTFLENSLMLTLFFLAAPLWGQHGGHMHGVAELNLVLNSDREMVAELITPAESVYGFEHAPRNAEETKQMNEGLKRLKVALSSMLAFERQVDYKITGLEGDGYFGTGESSPHSGDESSGRHEGHEAHGHTHHKEDHHTHHGEKHETKKDRTTEDHHHRNVVFRWRVRTETDLTGEKVIVNWSEALPDIHRMELTLLTPDRQDAISLRRSGAKVRL